MPTRPPGRVQALRAEGRAARARRWTSVGNDAVYFYIDPSRSAEVAEALFGELRSGTVLVRARYSACKKLARLRGGLVPLAYCWAHMRWDFIQCAAAQVPPHRLVRGTARTDRRDLPP